MQKTTMLTIALSLTPALALAQTSGSVRADARAGAGVKTPAATSSGTARATTRTELSPAARARLETTFREAERQEMPQEPIRARVAEAQVKGATEAQIVAAGARALDRLGAAHSAMVRAGRTRPNDEEITRGAEVLERGTTSAQLQALVTRAPADRSLSVALDAVLTLADRGTPVAQAMTQVQSRLAAGASDAAIASFATRGAAGVAGTTQGLGSAASGILASGSAAASAATAAGSAGGNVTGSVGGAVTGVVPKP
jgi:hypothetical protein